MIEINGGVRRRDFRIWYLILGVFVTVFLFTFLVARFKKGEVSAADLSKFDPGYIISDYQMGNYNSMTEAEIQAFLTKKNSCSNTSYSEYLILEEKYPNIKWHFKDGHFVCLSEELFGDGEVIGEGETAARIIWQAAQDYKINPQVLIVLLEKEQGLITDSFPNSVQYRSATGYGCPDTAACSEKYYGFKNQVRNAAAMFRTVLDGGWTNYPLGNNYIQYNPSASCGGSVVNIKNLATSALYRYTPYQPNAGALAAGYGTASCGAYGNRNFYLYFEDWFFGITVDGEWQEMVEPRVMEVRKSTQKVNPLTREVYDEWVGVGERYYFDSKIDLTWNGEKEVCLRTVEDTKNGVDRCIIMSRMDETAGGLYDETEIGVRRFEVVKDTYKYDLKTGEKVQTIDKKVYSEIRFSTKIVYNGKTYYRTSVDFKAGNDYFIPAEDLKEIPLVSFANFVIPRRMRTTVAAEYINLDTKEVCRKVSAGYIMKYTTKTEVEGKVYYRTEEDAKAGTACAVEAKKMGEIRGFEEVENAKAVFDKFLFPREIEFMETTYSIDLKTGNSCEKNYVAGSREKFVTKTEVEGKVYYRTEEDTKAGTFCVVPSEVMREVTNF